MSLVRRALLRRLAEAGRPVDEIAATIARARSEGRELTVRERDHLSKLKWARESGLLDSIAEDRADALEANAERWMGWDVAEPASDDWLLRPETDESWLNLYQGLSQTGEFLLQQGLVDEDGRWLF